MFIAEALVLRSRNFESVGRKTIYQPRRHLSQTHAINYAFYTGKATSREKLLWIWHWFIWY